MKIISYNSKHTQEKKKPQKIKKRVSINISEQINKEISEAVHFESGIRQGSLVPPFPFTILFHCRVLKKLN